MSALPRHTGYWLSMVVAESLSGIAHAGEGAPPSAAPQSGGSIGGTVALAIEKPAGLYLGFVDNGGLRF